VSGVKTSDIKPSSYEHLGNIEGVPGFSLAKIDEKNIHSANQPCFWNWILSPFISLPKSDFLFSFCSEHSRRNFFDYSWLRWLVVAKKEMGKRETGKKVTERNTSHVLIKCPK